MAHRPSLARVLLTDFGFAPPGDLALGYFMGFMTAALLIYAPLRCVLDEPAGSCDSEAEANVGGAGSADARPHGAVIAHRLSTVKKADLICVLDQGRIIESRRPRRLFVQVALPSLAPS